MFVSVYRTMIGNMATSDEQSGDESYIEAFTEEERAFKDNFLDTLYEFANEEQTPIYEHRPVCARCSRPISVCWCEYLPKEPVEIKTNIYILQHPFEESRKLKTAPMLLHSLPEGKCHIIRGKKFTDNRYPELMKVFQSTNTYLLYPAPGALDITELPPLDNGEQYNLIVIDGTWSQAKGIYLGNNPLQELKKVQIKHSSKSKYIIRTQPTDSALSTLECVAIALGILEQKPDLHEFLSRPLEALCKFQMNHGAVVHHSKVFKIANGLWKKPLPKKMLRKLEKEKLFEGDEECY